MPRTIFLVKAFTQDKTQGNPAGVVLDADDLLDAQMLKISSDLGFSESAFVQSSSHADYRVRFFSPKQEVSLCGHATIATFHTLVEQGKIKIQRNFVRMTQETQAGVLPVSCYQNGLIVMTQNKPTFGFIEKDKQKIAALLSLPASALLDEPIQSVSTGVPKLLIPVANLKWLHQIKPDLSGIRQYCRETGTRGFYPFTRETQDPSADFHARQFNPLAGIDEDPITGIAAGALGSYVVQHKLSPNKKFLVEQGSILDKAGRIFVEIGEAVNVGGYAVGFGIRSF
jgi:trans-2,3-dihydro-3-hydroxyanthranilate isomerase